MKYLVPVSVIFFICFFTFMTSFIIGSQQMFISDNDDFLSLIVKINNITSFLSPVLTFVFIVITTRILLDLYEVEFKTRTIIRILLLSMLPIAVTSCVVFFLVFLKENELSKLTTMSEIENWKIILNFKLLDLKFLYNLTWMFYIPFYIDNLMKTFYINIQKAIVITLLPLMLFLFFSLIFFNT